MGKFVLCRATLSASMSLAAVAVMAAACGGARATPTPSGSESNVVDALQAGDLCQYFTADAASEALGGPVQTVPQPAPINTAGTIVETCAYSNSAGTAAVLFRRSGAAAAEAAFDSARSATPQAIDLPGVGEHAFYNPADGQVVVTQQDTYFIVTLGSATAHPPATPDAALTRLASRIAGAM